ncbi:MAG: hypothetical protein GY719_34250 [bacterium]|nr:hypothetical protein [bacterium]
MLGHLIAIAGLALLCGAWVLVQRWIGRRDPQAPGVEGRCGNCGVPGPGSGASRPDRAC